MSDYCIENDFAAQREIAERERDTTTKLRAEVKELRGALLKAKEGFEKLGFSDEVQYLSNVLHGESNDDEV